MQEYDLYINSRKPALGLYVRSGAGLPDLAHPDDGYLMGLRRPSNCRPNLSKALKLAVTHFETWVELGPNVHSNATHLFKGWRF